MCTLHSAAYGENLFGEGKKLPIPAAWYVSKGDAMRYVTLDTALKWIIKLFTRILFIKLI